MGNIMRYKEKFREYDLRPAVVRPLEVVVDGGFEDAFRKFKAMFQNEKVVSEIKKREFYEKPSEKKRRKKREALERKWFLELREKMIKNGEWEKRMKRKDQRRKEKLAKRHLTKDDYGL